VTKNDETMPSVAPPAPVARLLVHDLRDDVAAGLRFTLDTFGVTTAVLIDPNSGRIMARWLDEAAFAKVAAWASTKNEAGWNIYFVVNQPIIDMAKKPTKSEIAMLRAAAFADIDAKDGRTLKDALATIALLPAPSVIIASGGGYQPIWMLPEPTPATAETIARSEALGGHIAKLVGGDAVQNVDRILRVPFTRNHPNKKKSKAGRVMCLSGLVQT
jgi:hypothetical protein